MQIRKLTSRPWLYATDETAAGAPEEEYLDEDLYAEEPETDQPDPEEPEATETSEPELTDDQINAILAKKGYQIAPIVQAQPQPPVQVPPISSSGADPDERALLEIASETDPVKQEVLRMRLYDAREERRVQGRRESETYAQRESRRIAEEIAGDDEDGIAYLQDYLKDFSPQQLQNVKNSPKDMTALQYMAEGAKALKAQTARKVAPNASPARNAASSLSANPKIEEKAKKHAAMMGIDVAESRKIIMKYVRENGIGVLDGALN